MYLPEINNIKYKTYKNDGSYIYTIFSRYKEHFACKCIFISRHMHMLFCWPKHSLLGTLHVHNM